VRLKLLRNEKETDWSDLRLLAETTDSHERPFAWLGELIRDSGRAERIRPILEDLITTAGMNPLIGRTWVETFKSARHALNAIHQLPDGQKAWAEAVAAVVDRTVEENTRPVLDRLVHVERRRLQASTRAWGAVGYGYTRFGAYLDGRNWLADWGRREDVEPWMLFNMVICKWHRRDYTNLRQLGETALSLSPDHTTPLHRIWLAAYEAALGGDIQAAERCLDQVSGQNLDPVSLAALALVRTAVEFLASPPAGMEDHEAAKRLRQVADEHRSTFRGEARLRRLYHRCQLNIARRAGRRLAAAWHWLRS
jgi:hypothetical protein